MIHNLHKTNQENSSSLPQTQLPGLPLGNQWQSLPQHPIVFPHHPFIDGPSLISRKRIAKKRLNSCSHYNHSAFPSPFSREWTWIWRYTHWSGYVGVKKLLIKLCSPLQWPACSKSNIMKLYLLLPVPGASKECLGNWGQFKRMDTVIKFAWKGCFWPQRVIDPVYLSCYTHTSRFLNFSTPFLT